MDPDHYANPPAFHSDDLEPTSAEEAAFHIIPVPWETSVSYGGGTRHGPAAILHASVQLEAYLDGSVPGSGGIHTAEPVDCRGEATEVLARIERAATQTLELGKFPILLGGEHAMTLAPVKALQAAGHTFGVVQIDAHADLRETYQGSPHSHACVMKRIHDLGIPLFQIGVRALSQAEADLRQRDQIPFLDADAIARQGIPQSILPPDFPESIFLTFDVDGFDPSVIPMTGTPEPGGLTWFEAIVIMERVTQGRLLLGADVVELAPRPGQHASDFTAAKLVYKIMDLALRAR